MQQRFREDIQTMTDKYIALVDKHLAAKEKNDGSLN
jgi:ribosome recycling factor